MRGVALAQAFRELNTQPVFVCSDLPGEAAVLVRAQGFEVELIPPGNEAAATVSAADMRGAREIVVDLGHADTLANSSGFVEYLSQLRHANLACSVIEGLDAECLSMQQAVPAAAIVVPYLGGETRRYVTEPKTRVYAGARYFPFRAEFAEAFETRASSERTVRRILVSFGGGNVARYNDMLCHALMLMRRSDLEVRITGAVSVPAQKNIEVRVLGTVQNMAEQIRWADLAVIGSGLTRYETALLGTPALAFALQPSHVWLVEEFARTGAIVDGGLINAATPETIAMLLENLMQDDAGRERMAMQGQRIVDGHGGARLAAEILQITSSEH